MVVNELLDAADAFPPGVAETGLAALLDDRRPAGGGGALATRQRAAPAGPFAGVEGRYPEPIRITPAGRTLAAALLRARALGPSAFLVLTQPPDGLLPLDLETATPLFALSQFGGTATCSP